jgi:hypothetical protein
MLVEDLSKLFSVLEQEGMLLLLLLFHILQATGLALD